MDVAVHPAPGRIRILIVNPDGGMRGALRALLASHADLHVVGEVGGGAEAVACLDRLDPDVVLMDDRTATALAATAVASTARRSRRAPRVLLLTTGVDLAAEPRTSDTDEVLFKGCDSETLLDHLRKMLPGAVSGV